MISGFRLQRAEVPVQGAAVDRNALFGEAFHDLIDRQGAQIDGEHIEKRFSDVLFSRHRRDHL